MSATDRCCNQGDKARAPDRWWQDAPCCHQEDPQAAKGPAAKNLAESGSGDSWAYRTHTSGPGHGKRIKTHAQSIASISLDILGQKVHLLLLVSLFVFLKNYCFMFVYVHMLLLCKNMHVQQYTCVMRQKGRE